MYADALSSWSKYRKKQLMTSKCCLCFDPNEWCIYALRWSCYFKTFNYIERWRNPTLAINVYDQWIRVILSLLSYKRSLLHHISPLLWFKVLFIKKIIISCKNKKDIVIKIWRKFSICFRFFFKVKRKRISYFASV